MENKVSERCPASFCVDGTALNQLLQDPRFNQVKIDASEKELVLFLGLSGSGKSTCINYLLGAKLLKGKRPGGKPCASLDLSQAAENAKYAEIGDLVHQFHTLHAEIYQDPISSLGYVDTAAFFNSSSLDRAEEVYGSFSAQLAVHSANAIKAVVIVIDWNIFNTTTATELKNLLYTLSQILPESRAISGSLIFLINKASKDITLHDFYESVVTFRVAQNEKKRLLEKKNLNVNSEEILRIKDEIRMIDLLEQQCQECQRNVILLDVFDNGGSRNRFYEALSHVQRSIPKIAFDFRKYNKNRELFEAEYHKEAVRNTHPQKLESVDLQITNESSWFRLQGNEMEVVFELMNQPDVANKDVNSNVIVEKEELTELHVKENQDVTSNLNDLDALYLINILIKALCIGLGIAGLSLSIIGVSAILNPFFAALLVKNIFHDAATFPVLYIVICGLMAIIASFVIYKISSLVIEFSNNNVPTFCEDNLQVVVAPLEKIQPFIKSLNKPLFPNVAAKSHISDHPGNDIGETLSGHQKKIFKA